MARLPLYPLCVMGLAISLLQLLVAVSPVDAGSANSFDLGQVQLTKDSRWADTQQRTLNYLLFIDPDRLLYNFHSNHKLSTKSAVPNGGWDAPDFNFQSHTQGHFLSAWSQCYAALGNTECLGRVTYFVAELARCQANNQAAGFNPGYLSGFPESKFDKLENGTLDHRHVPYYCLHKTLAGLLDAWRLTGNLLARDVLFKFADWTNTRTGALSYDVMQATLKTEHGGMNDVFAQLYRVTKDQKWLDVSKRFDHAAVFDPLAANQDHLNGLHANTQAAKLVGVSNEYHASGSQRYLDIARNAWNIIVNAHTYAIGGNSQGELFHQPNAITPYLAGNTCETCNTYNMLKLTRNLWSRDTNSVHYFDYYEEALLNHLLGVQDPKSHHGHIIYYTPLNPGGRREYWSTDYDTFWCCQSTSLETYTKLMDSIYWHDDQKTLYVNLYIPSKLNWKHYGIVITQSTTYPVSDTSKFTVKGSGSFAIKFRIPKWTTSGAHILVNGQKDKSITARPGSYAHVHRQWRSGDTITVKLPMTLRKVVANDNKAVAAVAFGPTILAGNYGDGKPNGVPPLDFNSIQRVKSDELTFKGTSNGAKIMLYAFYNAHEYNYNVYWHMG